MSTDQTRQTFPVENPQLGVTYGDFAQGTARRVFVPHITHVQESHDRAAIAETVEWVRSALRPSERYWIDPNNQTWPIKETATLVAMLACFAAILPLGLWLLRTEFFGALRGPAAGQYACSTKSYFKFAAINGVLEWLYLPLILVLFAVHKYVVPIDKVFPMMMVNGVVWWFLWVNMIGFLLFRRWYKRQARETGLTLADLGISYQEGRFALDKARLGKTVLLAAILFGFACLSEYVLEQIWIVDFRFIWPFASDLTPYRFLMFLLYFPFLLICFVLTGIFLHGQLRRPRQATWQRTFLDWSVYNILALVAPLILFLSVQYVPLLTTGLIPFEGPGGLFVVFILLLFHALVLLAITSAISTWFYQLTGKIYLGALVNAALIAWMFASSQVIAPIPV